MQLSLLCHNLNFLISCYDLLSHNHYFFVNFDLPKLVFVMFCSLMYGSPCGRNGFPQIFMWVKKHIWTGWITWAAPDQSIRSARSVQRESQFDRSRVSVRFSSVQSAAHRRFHIIQIRARGERVTVTNRH